MRNPLVIAVNALGITQITAWGTSFYCLGVLAKPIRLHHPAGNGRPMTYIACTRPRYPVSAGMHEKVQAMPHIRYRPIEAGHNCIISAPDLVARELLEIPR